MVPVWECREGLDESARCEYVCRQWWFCELCGVGDSLACTRRKLEKIVLTCGSLTECRAWLLGGLRHGGGAWHGNDRGCAWRGAGVWAMGVRDLLGYGVEVARWAEGATWAGWAEPGAGRLRGGGVAMLSSLFIFFIFSLYLNSISITTYELNECTTKSLIRHIYIYIDIYTLEHDEPYSFRVLISSFTCIPKIILFFSNKGGIN